MIATVLAGNRSCITKHEDWILARFRRMKNLNSYTALLLLCFCPDSASATYALLLKKCAISIRAIFVALSYVISTMTQISFWRLTLPKNTWIHHLNALFVSNFVNTIYLKPTLFNNIIIESNIINVFERSWHVMVPVGTVTICLESSSNQC